jgi:hypothetical protein
MLSIGSTRIFRRSGGQRGFALVTAILAVLILMALGYLALSISTDDIKISTRVVGEKKALSAAETGIHRLMQNFDPDPVNMAALQVNNVQVDAAADPASRYTISDLRSAALNPRDLTGFSDWEQKPYRGRVTGMNTKYDSNVQIDVGIGYAVPKGGGYQ